MDELGAVWDGETTSFALATAHAEAVELCLFESPDAPTESRRITLTRGGDAVFRGRVPEAGPGRAYGYRVHGPWAPERGLRFDATKLLVDPYARAVCGAVRWDESLLPGNGLDSAPHMPRALVVSRGFDWGDDRPPAVPWRETVLYETHVRGMTMRHPEVPEAQRGKYLGLAAPAVLEHLRALGVTTLSLLPVHQGAPDPHVAKLGLTNYWNYSPLAYFAPESRYASSDRGEQIDEFRAMVRELHRAGFEVLVDVVYNHTAEGDAKGPLYSLRGIDSATYYRLDPRDPAEYEDWSGCGNTLDLRQARTRALVLDSLRAWVSELHVDGFRFDLAPALAREASHFAPDSAFLRELVDDPVLSRVKLVAEPWDARPGGHQLGAFPPPFAEWNDRFRDTARRFWRGDSGCLADFATRLGGSEDVFAPGGRGPRASVNFVTCHDGFTLEDLVSHARKHNDANGEGGNDGAHENWSRGWGAEGPSADPETIRLRERMKRNFVATLAFAQGVPMLSHGDELSRTQDGNNNPYCHDGPLTWVDWALDPRRREFLEFCARAFALRRASPLFARERFLTKDEVTWLRPDGAPLTQEDWRDPERRQLGVRLRGARDALLLVNAAPAGCAFALPPLPEGTDWKGLLCTACDPPTRVRGPRLRVAAHSCLWLGAEDGARR